MATATLAVRRPPPVSLMSLPTELVSQILSELIPSIPEIGETRPVQYDKLIPEEPWFDPLQRRIGLYSACLTSRALKAIVLPLMYRVVALIDDDSIVYLLRTLIENPDYGRWTRFVSIHVTLTDEIVVREMGQTAYLVFREMDEACILNHPVPITHRLAALRVPHHHSAEFRKMIPQGLAFVLFSLLPRVETLLLQVPLANPDFATNDYTALVAQVSTAPEAERPLRNLKSLLLGADPEALSDLELESEHDGETLGVRKPRPPPAPSAPPANLAVQLRGCMARKYWKLAAACPKLDTLEITMDDGRWGPGRAFDPARLDFVRSVYLSESLASPYQVAQLLERFPNLDRLYFEPWWHEENVSRFDPEKATLTLDASLVRHGRNLRHLDLGWYDCQGDASPGIGEQHTLQSLARLPKLESLCVQFALLAESMEGVRGVPPLGFVEPPKMALGELLPPALEELTLEDWWWTDGADWTAEYNHTVANLGVDAHLYRHLAADEVGQRRSYRAAICDSLMGLAFCAPDSFPRLRRVRFLTRFPEVWAEPNAFPLVELPTTLENNTAEVAAAFEARGIEFMASEI